MTFRLNIMLMLLLGAAAIISVGCGGEEKSDPVSDADADGDGDGDGDGDSDGDSDGDGDEDTGYEPLEVETSPMSKGGGYVSINDGMWQGYAWNTAEGEFEDLSSVISPDDFSALQEGDALCTEGRVVSTFEEDTDPDAEDGAMVHSYHGLAMIGVNVNQEQDLDGEGTEVGVIQPTLDGISVKAAWRNPVEGGNFRVRIQLSGPEAEDNEKDRWCYELYESNFIDGIAFVPWDKFHSYCFDSLPKQKPEDRYQGQDVEAIVMQMPEGVGGEGTVRDFQMCLIDIYPDTDAGEADTGEADTGEADTGEDTGTGEDTENSEDTGGGEDTDSAEDTGGGEDTDTAADTGTE